MYESNSERPPKLEDEVRSHLAAVQSLSVQHKPPRGAPLLSSALASSGHGRAVQVPVEERTSMLLRGEATEALARADPVQLEAAWNLYQEAARGLDRSSEGAAVGAAAALRIAKLCDNCLAVRVPQYGAIVLLVLGNTWLMDIDGHMCMHGICMCPGRAKPYRARAKHIHR